MEAKFADVAFARDAYKRVVRRVLDSGVSGSGEPTLALDAY